MAEIRLFNDRDFKGGEVRVTGDEANLHATQGFGDRLSSVIVTSGTFTLFQDINFQGFSFTVSSAGGPDSNGQYPSPKEMADRNDVISSIRKNSDQP
jgi:Beta/Gamma crystallin